MLIEIPDETVVLVKNTLETLPLEKMRRAMGFTTNSETIAFYNGIMGILNNPVDDQYQAINS